MTDDAQHLVDAFAALAPHERYTVIVKLAGISEADAGPISDEELTSAAAEIFSMYDDEESSSGDPETR